ncbi:hypothetical protein EVAR_87048_1 [Eumeta japonica]|uniref:Uncharacterized protein n=1 Tax=Eumeta variegata TaxID=151549 RepID=A0A4C1SJ72_EUMVA|nr:hypothetical protein EVAR_87048_1 [Eumeta japonica]
MINNPKKTRSLRSLRWPARRREAVRASRGGQLYEIPCRAAHLARSAPTERLLCWLRVLRSNETEDENMHRLATQRAITEQNRARESSVERSQRLASQNSELWRTGNGNRVLIVLNVWPHRMPELWLTAIGNPVLNVLNVWPHRIPELWLTVIGNQALNDPND